MRKQLDVIDESLIFVTSIAHLDRVEGLQEEHQLVPQRAPGDYCLCGGLAVDGRGDAVAESKGVGYRVGCGVNYLAAVSLSETHEARRCSVRTSSTSCGLNSSTNASNLSGTSQALTLYKRQILLVCGHRLARSREKVL